MVRLVHHPFFDNFIILIIIMNTINLSVYDYRDREDDSEKNKRLERGGQLYTMIFTGELICKVIA